MGNVKLEINKEVFEFIFENSYNITEGFICDSYSVNSNKFDNDEYPNFRIEELTIDGKNCIYRLFVKMGESEEYKIDEFSQIRDKQKDTFKLETTFRLVERIITNYDYPLY